MIHLFPIEPIKERYSADWYRWWKSELDKSGIPTVVCDGQRLRTPERGDAIQHGQFLDALDTNYYKATQLASFIEWFDAGQVSDGDVVVFMDGWNPAVTSVGYIRNVVGIKLKIVLVLHAGTWDRRDHLSNVGMGSWASYNEKGWMEVADKILVATDFHKKMIEDWRHGALDKIVVTGFPLVLTELDRFKRDWSEKEQLVVFPHRIAKEKMPVAFDQLKYLYSEKYPSDRVAWIRSQDVYTAKDSLYELLGKAKVAFSAALQETWGIVQQEAWYLGAVPVVPDRLSYKELYPKEHRYIDMKEAVKMVHSILHAEENPSPEFRPTRHPHDAFENIIREIRGLHG